MENEEFFKGEKNDAGWKSQGVGPVHAKRGKIDITVKTVKRKKNIGKERQYHSLHSKPRERKTGENFLPREEDQRRDRERKSNLTGAGEVHRVIRPRGEKTKGYFRNERQGVRRQEGGL